MAIGVPTIPFAQIGRGLGQTIRGGLAQIGEGLDKDKAASLLEKKLENFEETKKQAADEIATLMFESKKYNEKMINSTRNRIMAIEDKGEFLKKTGSFLNQWQRYESSGGAVKKLPLFGIRYETYTKETEAEIEAQAEREKTQATQARQQQAQQVGQQAVTEQRGLRTTGFQPTGEPGFQKFEPVMEEQVTEPVPATREQATARFAAGAEGFQPTPKETTGFEKGLGQQFPTRGQLGAERREERLTDQNIAAATQQQFENDMKRKTAARQTARLVLAQKGAKTGGLKVQKSDIEADLDDTVKKIGALEKAIADEKGKHKSMRNATQITQWEGRLEELQEVEKAQKKDRKAFTTRIAELTGTLEPTETQPSEEEFANNFPGATTEDIRTLKRLSNSINSATGKAWTIDELIEKWKLKTGSGVEEAPALPSLGAGGYPFGGG